MAERTADEVAKIFANAGDSVTVIGIAKTAEETDTEYKDKMKRNVLTQECLRRIRNCSENLEKVRKDEILTNFMICFE